MDQLLAPSVERRRRSYFVLDVLNCFAGGVFLATSLLHMLPDVRRDFDRALREISNRHFTVDAEFPTAEFITTVGFFAVLLFEEVTRHLSVYWLTSMMLFAHSSSLQHQTPLKLHANV